MLADFGAAAKRARAAIVAPEVPLQTILAQAAQRRRGRLRAFVLSGVISLATIGTAAAFGPSIYQGVHLWLTGNGAALAIHDFALVDEPLESDLRDAIRAATFPVVLPVGLPDGTHIGRMQYAPSSHPNAIFIEYRNPKADFNVGFAIFQTSAITAGKTPPLPGGLVRPLQETYTWQVGSETVLVLKQFISANRVNAIKRAMLASSPMSSLAATVPMLGKATVVGAGRGLERIAERYAPRDRPSVVVGRTIPAIPQLAKNGKPLIDSHLVYLTNIPSVHGEPDYRNAMVRWPRDIAIEPQGVRAVDAVLRVNGKQPCRCVVIFSKPGHSVYSVWEVPWSRGAVRKYTVNATTFEVHDGD